MMSRAAQNQLHQARACRTDAKHNRCNQTTKARAQRHLSESTTDNNALFARKIKALKKEISNLKEELVRHKRVITRLQNKINKLINGTQVASDMKLNTAIAVVQNSINKFGCDNSAYAASCV